MWTIKETKNSEYKLLHQHEDKWVEAYTKAKEFYCSKCNDQYPHAELAIMANVHSRPNPNVYTIFDSIYRKVALEINPPPPSNLEAWDKKGHLHDETSFLPIVYASKTICPHCLEEAPDPAKYTRLMRKQKLSEPVLDLTRAFRVVSFAKRKYHEYKFQLY